MNTLNLNQYVDSSSLFYLAETLGLITLHGGLVCDINPFNSSFVSLKSAGDTYKLGNLIISYPLYSRGKGVN
jgi:hypothetical protein